MKKLSKDENKLADDFSKGKFKKVSTKLDLKAMALASKEARINLRLQVDVLSYFQSLAEKQGIPYQTLINSVLYKMATGQLIDKGDEGLMQRLEKISKKIDDLKKGA